MLIGTVFLYLLANLGTVTPLKVLVYSPAFAGSHTNFMARLADTLTEAGHNVTFFMPIFDEKRSNQLGVKLTKDVIKLEQDFEMKRDSFTIDNITETFWHIDVNSKSGHHLFEPLHRQAVSVCGNIFRNKEFIEELRSRDYDVAFAVPLMTRSLALFRHIGIEKVVIASSCPNYDVVMNAMGEPADTSYVPAIFSEASGDQMDFANRLENYDMYNFMVKTYGATFDAEAEVYRSFLGQDFPDWHELIPDASLHFANSIPYLDFPRPAIQKTIDIGGITVDLEKIRSEKLSSNWDEILNKRQKNMFISFGSIAKSSEMPQKSKENLLKVFKSEPNVTFIWKYESDDVEFAEDDKRIHAFLGHGGLGSTYEAIFLEKPAIMVPIFFDQARNSHMLSRLGMTITLHKRDLGDLRKLKNAFKEILHNESYEINAEKVADVIRNQPFSSKELVLKYIEFVGKYGPFNHMTPYSLKMPWYQRYSYDVYLYKFFTYSVSIVIIFFAFKIVLSFLPLKLIQKTRKIE